MSTQTPTATNAALTTGKSIDEIAAAACVAFNAPESIEQSLAVARGIKELRVALTGPVMEDVMGLMNTSIGFRTDKDPAQPAKDGKTNTPYAVEVVRDVFIEARLRGFHPLNNEFNIIAGRFYGCVNGFERLVKTNPKVTDFKDNYGLPVFHGEDGATVKASASWKQEGVPQTLEREFAVRVNRGMGADAVIGKAKRKLLAAVHSRLTGVVTPEGEAGDEAIPVNATATSAAPDSSTLFGAGQPVNGHAASTTARETTAPTPAKEEPAKPKPVETASAEETAQQAIGRLMTESGVTFDDFRDFIAAKGLLKDKTSVGSYDELPQALADRIKASTTLQAECIKKFGKVQTSK